MLNRGKVKTKYFFSGLTTIAICCITHFNAVKARDIPIFLKSLTGISTLQHFENKFIEDDTTPSTKIAGLNQADTIPRKIKDSTLTNAPDSIEIVEKDSLQKDTTILQIDSLLISKDSLDAPIEYSADDSGVLIVPTKQLFLYGKAKVKQLSTNLEAGTIEYDQKTNTIKAFGGTDTTLGPLNQAVITQNGTTSRNDTIFYNLKTQKGLTKNTYYNEGEIYVHAQRFKKVSPDVAYAYKTTFTTCNLDTPHFDIRARKLKIINNKIGVSGPAFIEFEGVPMPIGLPFGIYPLSRGRHSGILAPQFASNESFGLGLEGLGYYKVINDNWDIITRANIYTYGGWNLDINPEYYKRYRYRGNLDLQIQKTKILNSSGLSKSEFTQSNGFFLTWNHSTDPKARPGTSFTANVRAGSTKFNQYIPNNAFQNYQNQLSSSITWNRTWNQGKYNLSIAGNHDQNNNLGLINVRLPTVNFSASTIYPFQKKEAVGTPKWYEKLGISYNGTFLNQVSFYDSAINFKRLLDTAQWGADHTIPITLSLPSLGPLNVAPTISYEERWYGQLINREWDPSLKKVDTSIQKGFYTAREMNFGINLNTRIFGTYNFGKNAHIMALRHEIKPFISLNYKPSLVGRYYSDVQIDTLGNTYHFSKLDGGVVGSFSDIRFGGMSFGIDNLFEMKVRDKDSTNDENNGVKKVRLIDGLGITGGYNFMADSLNWSPFSISLRSNLLNKINITGNASIDPYQIDTLGRRINQLMWKEGKVGRFTGGNIAISTNLRSKPKDKRSDNDRLPVDPTLTGDEQQAELDYIRNNPSEFVDFNNAWSLNLSYSLNFYRALAPDLRSFTTQINSTIRIDGDISLAPKWKLGGGTYFDFKSGTIQAVSLYLTRDMHCWQMAINVQVGQFKSFSITLNPKSGVLRDLKINRVRTFSNF
ncbi:MAG: LPS-assembly protein LptD [Bacteroidetes bacterium]|nr:LPS-assembly protein LptD [Bacteroidota bacterium]